MDDNSTISSHPSDATRAIIPGDSSDGSNLQSSTNSLITQDCIPRNIIPNFSIPTLEEHQEVYDATSEPSLDNQEPYMPDSITIPTSNMNKIHLLPKTKEGWFKYYFSPEAPKTAWFFQIFEIVQPHIWLPKTRHQQQMVRNPTTEDDYNHFMAYEYTTHLMNLVCSTDIKKCNCPICVKVSERLAKCCCNCCTKEKEREIQKREYLTRSKRKPPPPTKEEMEQSKIENKRKKISKSALAKMRKDVMDGNVLPLPFYFQYEVATTTHKYPKCDSK